MSFVILLFIFAMLYVSLKKYSSAFSVALVVAAFFGTTTAFLFYGINKLSYIEVFSIVNTEINGWAFYHMCAAWYIADLFVAYRAVRQYRLYVKVNEA